MLSSVQDTHACAPSASAYLPIRSDKLPRIRGSYGGAPVYRGCLIYPLELETGAVLTLNIYNRDLWNSKLYRAMPFHENVDRDGVCL